MGFYIRDSIRVGPFRFNLSKSGVGVSVGVRGLRVGSGPRGNYVHMGAHGLYYRATLPSRGGRLASPGPGAVSAHDGVHEIESGSVAEMRDSSSADLLREIDAKRRTTRLAPVVGFLGAVAAAGAAFLAPDIAASMPPAWASWAPLAVPGVLVIATVVGVVLAHRRDVFAKTVVLFYELESDAERDYQELHNAFGELLSCHAVWHVEAAGATGDWKRSGGATTTVRRKRVGLSRSAPLNVKTNIAMPTIPCGRETLYLFPDRVLVFAPEGVGAVSYADLSVERGTTRFVEDGVVPRDAEVVDSTWQHVNRGGGPDRRFKNNRQIPLVLYEELHLRSTSGLNELLQLSRRGAGGQLASIIARLGREVFYSAERNGKGAGAADDQPSAAAPDPPSDLRWTGTWARVSEAQRLECEYQLRKAFRAPSLLANRGAQALGRCSATGDVLYWIPAAPAPLVVVHYNQPGSEGQPTHTYYQGATAWNKWVPG